jgi:hypothetical protein
LWHTLSRTLPPHLNLNSPFHAKIAAIIIETNNSNYNNMDIVAASVGSVALLWDNIKALEVIITINNSIHPKRSTNPPQVCQFSCTLFSL